MQSQIKEQAHGDAPSGTTIEEEVFVFPATVAQHRFWLLDQIHPGNPALNVPLASLLTGPLDVELLERVLNEIVKRHELLRTSFQVVDGNLVQIIHCEKEIPLPRFDVTQALESERETEINELLLQEGKIPFALEKGPLLRAGLIKLREDEHIFLLTIHHIGFDGWSSGVLIREVAQLYNAFIQGESLPDLPLQYADFALWQSDWLKTPAAMADRQFWRTQLEGTLPFLNLPTDHPRRASRSNNSTIHTLLLPGSLTEAVKSYCNSESLTSFMVFFAAYAVLLHRYSGQSDITIGSPAANRNQVDLEGVIGLFSNPLLLRLKFSPGLTLRGLMNQVKTLSVEVMEHQAYPFEKVVEEIQIDSSRSGLTWLQAYFIFQKAFMLPQQMADVTLKPLRSVSPGAMFEWMMGVLERTEGIRLQLEYNTDLFDESTIDRVLHQFQYLLETIVTDKDLQIDKLPILTPQERQKLVLDWNETQPASTTAGRFVHTLFEEQVMRTPDAPAFQDAKTQIRYSEVNLRVNQLAHFLQTKGLPLRGYVGLALERDSIDFALSFLAILKAGGCCLPLDLPNDTALLARLVANSQLKLLIGRNQSTASLETMDKLQIIDLDQEANLIGSQPEHNPSLPLADKDPAYVSFTARARNGAVITHTAFSHSVAVARQELELTGQDCVAFSLTEMLPALLSGAKLVFRTGAGKFNAPDWWQWAGSQGVTVAALPTAYWHDLVHSVQQVQSGTSGKLRLMVIGGSQISPPALLAWQQIAAGRIRLLDRFLLAEAGGAIAFTEPTATGSSPGRVSIVRPAPNTRIYLLDEQLHPVPMGVPGSLFVGSDHLASDYIPSAETLDQEFVADPISGKTGSRLMKTGDTGRFLPSGGIELLGRVEDLAKTDGFHLELCEIRSTILRHTKVRDAVLIPRETSGGRTIVAYVLPMEKTPALAGDLRAFMTEHLPEYMGPYAFVILDQFPLTPNGKVDRNALPEPQIASPVDTFTPPSTSMELIVAQIWSEVLGVKQVGVCDNFFESGGNSLLAVKFITRINKSLGLHLTVPVFFQNPTVKQLAKKLDQNEENKRAPNLIQLHPGRSAGALFLLDTSMGLCRLADHLKDGGTAIYGTVVPLSHEVLRAADSDKFDQLPSLQELAAPHVALIESCQSSGPYFLAGHSVGGVLAFEVAHQLCRRGRQVEIVFLLDTLASLPIVVVPPWWQRLRRMTFARAKSTLKFRSARLWKQAHVQISRITAQRQRAITRGTTIDASLPPKHERMADTEESWEVIYKVYRNAWRRYAFLELESRAVLFRTEESTKARQNDSQAFRTSLGWDGRFRRGLEIENASGDHLSLLKEPHVTALAQQFKKLMEQVEANSLIPGSDRAISQNGSPNSIG